MKEHTKKELIRISIVFGFMLILTLFVILSFFIKKDSSEQELRHTIETYVALAQGEGYTIESKLKVASGLSETMSFYKLQKGKTSAIVSMVRITGFSGPQTCLFFFDEESLHLSFVSVLGLQTDAGYSLVENYFDYGITDSILSYWMKTILNIIQKGVLI